MFSAALGHLKKSLSVSTTAAPVSTCAYCSLGWTSSTSAQVTDLAFQYNYQHNKMLQKWIGSILGVQQRKVPQHSACLSPPLQIMQALQHPSLACSTGAQNLISFMLSLTFTNSAVPQLNP